MTGNSHLKELRPYQEHLVKVALRQNVVIYLPTGAGKTFVAAQVIQEMSCDLSGSLANGGKRTLFLVNTTALAHQQAEYILKTCGLKTSVYTGEMNLSSWRGEKWSEEFNAAKIIVSTTDLMLTILLSNYLSIKNINLIIFDECHHAKKGHPMFRLLELIANHQNKFDFSPRLIGLTAILLDTPSKSTLHKDLHYIENSFKGKIVTARNLEEFDDVLFYATKPNEVFIKFNHNGVLNPIFKKLPDKIQAIQRSLPHSDTLKDVTNLLQDVLYQLNDLGFYGCYITLQYVLTELEAKQLLYPNMREVKNAVESIYLWIKQFVPEDPKKLSHFLSVMSSAKVLALLQYLNQIAEGKNFNDIKCVIFADRRLTVKCLYVILHEFLKSNRDIPLIVESIVGHNKKMLDNNDLRRRSNKEVLPAFKNNECNLLIASNVIEEGIDVQSCNFVIMYDGVKSFRSYIQSKGRSRNEDSRYVIFAPNNEIIQASNEIKEYQQIQEDLKKYLIEKAIDSNSSINVNSSKDICDSSTEYFTTSLGAKLEPKSAISLLNRYCQTLPTDLHPSNIIEWKSFVVNSETIAKIILPYQSNIRQEIASDPKANLKLAKVDAAFKACKMLYAKGELNNNLMPITKANYLEDVDSIYFGHWKEFPNDNDTAGTRKNRRIHDIQYPKYLCSSLPSFEDNCYLSLITINIDRPDNPEYTGIYDLLKIPHSFAILTTKPLPQIAAIPIYTSFGEILVKIENNRKTLKVTSKLGINRLIKFHHLMMQKILNVSNSYLAADYLNQENSFLIVPTNNRFDIDWDLVTNFQSFPNITLRTEQERAHMNIIPDDFINKTVSTTYLGSHDEINVVTRVRYDLLVSNRFPSKMYLNYDHYYRQKHKINVVHKSKYLLQAYNPSKLNPLIKENKDPDVIKKFKHIGDVVLVPELCFDLGFPGDMWLKAMLLPSILHRVHHLLLAEELRESINSFVSISNVYPDSPKPLSPKQNENPLNLSNIERICKCFPGRTEVFSPFASVTMDFDFLNPHLESCMHKSTCTFAHPTKSSDTSINILRIHQGTNILEQRDLLSALTAASANDFVDMERMEILGDSFLKFGISFFLMHEHPLRNEGFLSAAKGKFVSNRNLFYCAMKAKIPGMIKANPFDMKMWRPPLQCIPRNAQKLANLNNAAPDVYSQLKLDETEAQSGICKEATLERFLTSIFNVPKNTNSVMYPVINKQFLADKVCSDSVEAIIGACLKSYGVEQAFYVLMFLEIIPRNRKISNILNLNLGSPRLRSTISDRDIQQLLPQFPILEHDLGYNFNDRAFLLQALTHPSCPTNSLTGNYQQLEFIGDAILDFLVSCYIFERCQHMNPGKLTDLRSALVNNITLACVSVRCGFHKHLLMNSMPLTNAIETFEKFQKENNHKITDQVRIIFKNPVVTSNAEYIEAPKALGDIFESLVGAVFLDSGNDLEVTWRVIHRLLNIEILEFMKAVPLHVVRRLFEYPKANPVFRKALPCAQGSRVECSFRCGGKTLTVSGYGSSSENAKTAASSLALHMLDKNG